MKIVVVDDHQMFGEGLRLLLGSRHKSVKILLADSSDAALNLIEREGDSIDLMLLDLNLPGMSGISLLREFKARGVEVPVLVVSASQSISDARSAIHHGAFGFVSKASDTEILLKAIDTVLNGEIYLPDGWDSTMKSSNTDEGASVENITDRQLEVLHLVSQGMANKTIADKLGLSENTVKVHLREVFKALKATNRTACVVEAKRLGLIENS